MSVRYWTPASLGRMSFSVGPLNTSLISALLSLAGSRHTHTLPVAYGTREELLHQSDISSTSNATLICCFCNPLSSSLSGCCNVYATLQDRLGIASLSASMFDTTSWLDIPYIIWNDHEDLLVMYIVTDWCYYNYVSHWIQNFMFTYRLVGNVRGYHWLSTHIINIYFLHVIVDQC